MSDLKTRFKKWLEPPAIRPTSAQVKKRRRKNRIILRSVLFPLSLVVLGCVVLKVWTAVNGRPMTSVGWLMHSPKAIAQLKLMTLTAVCVYFGLLVAIYRKPKQVHGDARWSTRAEVDEAGLRATYGVVCGTFPQLLGQGPLLIAEGPHVLLQAPSGGGKGAGVINPTLLGGWSDSAIVLDVKGDLFKVSSGYRQHCGQKIFRFNPFDIDGNTHRYNPLGHIAANNPNKSDEVQRVVALLYPLPEKTDPIWAVESRNLVLGVILKNLASAAREGGNAARTNLAEAYKYLRSEQNVTLKIKEDVAHGRVPDNDARVRLLSFAEKPSKMAESILSTATTGLEVFGNDFVATATEESDFDLRDLRREQITVYLNVSFENLKRLAPLMRLIFQQTVEFLARNMPGDDEPHEVLMLIDEMPVLGHMPMLLDTIGFMRSFGVRMLNVIQGPPQLRDIYGPEGANSFIENSRVRMAMTPNLLGTAQYISSELGNYTQSVAKTSYTTSSGSSSRNRSVDLIATPLMRADEIMRLSEDDLIIQVQGARPVRAKKIRYYEDPMFIARLMPEAKLKWYGLVPVPAPAPAPGVTPGAMTPAPAAPAQLEQMPTVAAPARTEAVVEASDGPPAWHEEYEAQADQNGPTEAEPAQEWNAERIEAGIEAFRERADAWAQEQELDRQREAQTESDLTDEELAMYAEDAGIRSDRLIDRDAYLNELDALPELEDMPEAGPESDRLITAKNYESDLAELPETEPEELMDSLLEIAE